MVPGCSNSEKLAKSTDSQKKLRGIVADYVESNESVEPGKKGRKKNGSDAS